jgi:Ca-activated chloride channel homolog
MTFLSPERLWILLAVAAVAALYVVMQRRRRAYAVRFTQLHLLDKVAPRRPGWRRHVPAAAFLVCLTLLVLGFSRPEANVKVPRERATVVVAVDTSLSMEATDVRPSRLEAAKSAAVSFIQSLPATFNVGLVAFSGQATVAVAPTTNHAAVEQGVQALNLGPSTAIGEAVYTSLNAIASHDATLQKDDATPPPARIVLLSDGTNTVGRDPSEAADAAKQVHVPVSTIAYGTAEGTVEAQGQTIPVPVDGPSLEKLANATGGEFYEAKSGDELKDVYKDIGSSIGYRTERHEVTSWFVGAALLAALAAAAASLRWFARLP